jgi:hypothetical protein
MSIEPVPKKAPISLSILSPVWYYTPARGFKYPFNEIFGDLEVFL